MKGGVFAIAVLVLAGCGRSDGGEATAVGAGARLEAAAIAQGLVVDASGRAIVGAWAHETDRACIVPGEGDELRIGLLIDYGAGSGCAASGTAARHGSALDLRLGECRLTAHLKGDRLTLPPEVPTICDRLCAGHATLAAMSVGQQSGSLSEARSLRAPSGRLLCPG